MNTLHSDFEKLKELYMNNIINETEFKRLWKYLTDSNAFQNLAISWQSLTDDEKGKILECSKAFIVLEYVHGK